MTWGIFDLQLVSISTLYCQNAVQEPQVNEIDDGPRNMAHKYEVHSIQLRRTFE